MDANDSNSFHITDEDEVGKTARLKELFSFLGASKKDLKIDEILSMPHSYKLSKKKAKIYPIEMI